MRIALIATGAAALVAVPMALSMTEPQMSADQFVSAVRCTAYDVVTQPKAETGAARMQLNSEALRQPAATVEQARAEASQIARQAVISESAGDGAMLRQERAAACAGAQLATFGASDDAA
jgi:hypothetical protein